MPHPWLHRFAILLAVATLLLLLAGALVTSNQAGLSVPDWPLSYGQVMPEMKGGVFYEHGHRMVATTVGLLTIILAAWLWRADDRRWIKRIGLIALAAVIVQGVLGGLTVRYLMPKPVSVGHACLAQLFFATTVAIAVFTSRSWRAGAIPVVDTGWPSLRSLSVFTSLAVLAQIALGAGYRHRAFGVMPHVIGALVVTAVVLMVAIFVLAQFESHRSLRRAAHALIWITGAQVLVGIAAYTVRASNLEALAPPREVVLLTVLHVALGALTLAGSVVLMLDIFHHVRPREAATAAGGLPATPAQ